MKKAQKLEPKIYCILSNNIINARVIALRSIPVDERSDTHFVITKGTSNWLEHKVKHQQACTDIINQFSLF